MPDGSALAPTRRTAAQENTWQSLLVSRKTLLDAGVDLDRRMVSLGDVRPKLDLVRACACGTCSRCMCRARVREARDAATEVRKETRLAPKWERLIYGRSYGWNGLDRPPREYEKRGIVICSDAAPPGRRKRSDDEPEHDGYRYPLVSDYTSKAALFDLFDFRELDADDAAEISLAGSLIGSSDGFRRVDPTWARMWRELTRQRYRDPLEREHTGRALIQPPSLVGLLRDFPAEHHDLVRLVHEIVSQYCAALEDSRLTSWGGKLARELRPTAYWIFRHGTPKPRGGGARKSIPSLVDEILQYGFRESCPPYIREARPQSRVADVIACRWCAHAERAECSRVSTVTELTSKAAQTRSVERWPVLPASLAERQRRLLLNNLTREIHDG